MNEPRLTISGNVVFDAEERVAASGQPFAVFRIANNISRRRDDGRYEDVRTEFYRVTAFGNLAVNAIASVKKGQRVLVHGKVRATTYTRGDGSEGANIEITASMIGHDLTFGYVDYHKGRANREDPKDPQNDPIVRSVRESEDSRTDPETWGRSGGQSWSPGSESHSWNPDYDAVGEAEPPRLSVVEDDFDPEAEVDFIEDPEPADALV